MFIAYALVTILLGYGVFLLRHHWTANLALLLFTLSLCFTGMEAYYRYFYVKSDGMGALMKNFSDRYYRLDSHGLRASHLPLSKTKDNLIVLGDSHVFGAGLKHPSDRFAELLAKHHPALHVINLGFPGWDTKTEAVQFEKYVGDNHARIPLVILTYFYNDIEEEATPADRERNKSPQPAGTETALDRALQSISRYSRFVQMIYYRIGYPRLVQDRLGQIQQFYQDPIVRDRHLATLVRFRDVLKQRYSANLLIVLLPYLHNEELLHKTAFYGMFEQALAQRGFDFVSLQPVFATYPVEKLWVNRFDPHTNPFANRLIAEAIIKHLSQHPEALSSQGVTR